MTLNTDAVDGIVESAKTITEALTTLKQEIDFAPPYELFYGYFIKDKLLARNDVIMADTGDTGILQVFLETGGPAMDHVATNLEGLLQPYRIDLPELFQHMEAANNPRRQFLAALIDYGFAVTWIAPIVEPGIAGYGVLNHFCGPAEAGAPVAEDLFVPLANAFHQALRKHGHLARYKGLTLVEMATLTQLSRGQTAEEIAAKDGVSSRAVEMRIQNARKKLGARNAVEAVYNAAAYGALSPAKPKDPAAEG